MGQNQSLNVNSDFFNGFSSVFIKFVIIIIGVYLIIMILNFLRDKFINQQTYSERDDITELLTLLNKLFFISGFGFIIGNVIQAFLNQNVSDRNFPMMNIGGKWDYLIFGIILIFTAIGLNVGKKMIIKERTDKPAHP